MRHAHVLSLAICVFCAGAEARQPISESLVDCAAIFTVSNRAFPERHTEKTEALDRAANRLLQAATRRASAEGHEQADVHVAELYRAKSTAWDARGVGFIFSDEFRAWARYCRALSKRLRIGLGGVGKH